MRPLITVPGYEQACMPVKRLKFGNHSPFAINHLNTSTTAVLSKWVGTEILFTIRSAPTSIKGFWKTYIKE